MTTERGDSQIIATPPEYEKDQELIKLRAQVRRLQDENAELIRGDNTNAALRLLQAERTILNQQVQLTQLNKAITRRNHRIALLEITLSTYRTNTMAAAMRDSSMTSTLGRRLEMLKQARQQAAALRKANRDAPATTTQP